MSKNRRHQQEKSSAPISLGLSEGDDLQAEIDETIHSNQPDDSSALSRMGKIGWWSYIKQPSHWWVVGLIALLSLGATGAGLKYLEESAREQKAGGKNSSGKQEMSLLNNLNPFAPLPTPTATPQLSKEYIYAGSRMLAAEDANASALPPADLAVWRPSTGYWYVLGGQGSQPTQLQWGQAGDITAPADYDGDGKTDAAIVRPNYPANGQATWFIQFSSTGTFIGYQYGTSTDTPAPADFDGDGKADLAVWRSTAAAFYYSHSNTNYTSGDTITCGSVGDSPVVGDYDGDGRADAAVRSGNNWVIKQSSDNATQTISWQYSTDQAVQNDYDGDGKVDIAVWRDAIGYWLIRQSSHIGQANELRQVQWGASGDVPVPAFYRR